MAKTNKQYWLDRADRTIMLVDNAEARYLKTLNGSYQRSFNSIDKDIQAFWSKYSGKNGITYAQAKQAVTASQQRIMQADAVKAASNITRGDARLKQDLINFSKKPQVTRLESLQADIQMELSRLGNNYDRGLTNTLGNTLDNKYLQERYTIDVGSGFGSSFNRLPQTRIKQVLQTPWSGNNYSQILWGNTKKLADITKQELTQGIIRGDSTQEMSAIIRDKFNSSYSAAERLVRTEMTNIATESDMLAYTDSNISRYEYVATLDERTSDICGSLDGENFEVANREVGVNAPPMHPNCRSTTIAYFGADFKKGLERRARDAGGKSVLVPANMTYTEWKKEFLNG